MNFRVIILFFVVASVIAAETPSEFTANAFDGGYTWTLPSHLGDALKAAEQKYGERDRSWTILGVEFTKSGPPQVWYPGSNDGRRDVIVQLTTNCAGDMIRQLFQLSHESIHLLSPTGSGHATVFEEGLAAYFSIVYIQNRLHFGPNPDQWFQNSKYLPAYHIISNVYRIHPDADARIRMLRNINKQSLSAGLTPAMLTAVFPLLSNDVANTLCQDYQSWNP